MKKKVSYILLIFIIVSCSKDVDSGNNFIANNLIKIIDTASYNKGSLIYLPNVNVKTKKKLEVHLERFISNNNKVDEIILNYLEKNKILKAKFNNLFINGKLEEFYLNSNFPKKIGRFEINFNDKLVINQETFAGSIEIQNLKIYENKALLVVTESFGKFGKTFIIFFQKADNNWIMFHKDILYQS